MNKLLCIAAVIMLFQSAGGAIVTKEVIYKQDSTTFKGFIAYDDKIKDKRPGILVFHEWWGLNDFAKAKTKELAALGYVAFAPDMYGNGAVTTDPAIAGKMAGEVRGTPLLRKRAVLGLATLLKQEYVNPDQIAAIGFCFGGTAVLELAYSGAAIKGVAAFHAGIIAPKPEDRTLIKAKILVLHGADDPYNPVDSLTRFQDAMKKAHADWQMVYFGNAVHGFTNPANGTDNSKGLAYNALAAARSWNYMKIYFGELFNTVKPRE